MYYKKFIINSVLITIVLVLSLQFLSAAASFKVDGFSCSPNGEVAVESVFSCTAQIKNIGDASGSVSIATLYPDSNDWLENANYVQASGVSVGAGQSTEITFSGLKAIKSGNNGFSKIMLDKVTDTEVTNYDMNVIDVIISVDNSASSVAIRGTFDSEAEVIAGGNINVVLTLSIISSGCSIGSQDSQKIINGMTNGNKQSRIWTITQGSSGNCVFKIIAAASGANGLAFKSDSTQSSVTCSNCPLNSNQGGGSSSSGGGGGGSTLNQTNTSEKEIEKSEGAIVGGKETAKKDSFFTNKKFNYLFWILGGILLIIVAFIIIKLTKKDSTTSPK